MSTDGQDTGEKWVAYDAISGDVALGGYMPVFSMPAADGTRLTFSMCLRCGSAVLQAAQALHDQWHGAARSAAETGEQR